MQNLAIFILSTFSLLNATELNTISNCNNNNQECKIDTTYKNQSIQNHNSLSLKQIKIETQLIDFINYGTLTLTEYITINGSGNSVKNFINHGTITTTSKYSLDTTSTANGGFENIYNYGNISGYVYIAGGENSATYIHNYGTMGGAIKSNNSNQTIYVNNYGTINLCETNSNNGCTKKAHFKNVSNLVLQDYAMRINVDSVTFNAFDGNATDNSHLVLDSVTNVSFVDSAKLILEFGEKFEFGAEYKLDKLIVKADDGANALSVDFDRLMAKNDIYALYKQGDYFIARLQPQHSAISNIYKSNIRTMNNFYIMSNSMIYPRKSYHLQESRKDKSKQSVTLIERSNQRISKSNIRVYQPKAHNDRLEVFAESKDSANILKSYESFAYRNESINRRIQRQNKRNYNRKSQNLTQTPNYSQTPHDYYFILTPFVNYNSFTQSGNYNLSGFDYGFLTAFSTKVAETHSTASTLGVHFAFSYGSLGDLFDKSLSIKSMDFMVGLHYKLDLIYSMFFKARGDVFYFLNTLDSTTLSNIKPNNLGFGANVAFGKDFDFKEGGILGIELGLDYKGLNTNKISVYSTQTYQKALYHLLYVDFGVNYAKYFGGFGVNLGAGFKTNLAPKLAKSKLLFNSHNLNFTLNNDKYLGYVNAGLGYLMQKDTFDMEFSLAYYGNFGDMAMSNGGGFEWRVMW